VPGLPEHFPVFEAQLAEQQRHAAEQGRRKPPIAVDGRP